MNIDLLKLNKKITNCNKCSRLVKFRNQISLKKRKQNLNETYWGKPVTGFGDKNAKILILGLAPAAHGGTRTGRAFTGDKSGDFLFKCLFSAKIANQSSSTNINDGLKLNSTYITNILKCVPPGDKPHLDELKNCSIFFDNEIFKHGKKYMLPDGKILIPSYHPSPRNVNTKLINLKMMKSLFIKARQLT